MKSATLSLSYYTANLFSTLIICFAATGLCLTYVAIVGWNMLLADIFLSLIHISVANKYELGEVLSACDTYFKKTGRRVTFEYSLVHEVNDTDVYKRQAVSHIQNTAPDPPRQIAVEIPAMFPVPTLEAVDTIRA